MIRKNLVQSRHDETAGAGEDLISAPDHIIRRADHGIQWPEDQPAGRAYGFRHALEAKSTAHFSFAYSASLTGSSHSVDAPSFIMERCWNQLVCCAPCQCFTFSGMVTLSESHCGYSYKIPLVMMMVSTMSLE